MKNFCFIGVFSVMFLHIAYGQDTSKKHLDSLVSNFIADLKTKGVDTILVFEDYWVGGQPFVDGEKDWCYTKDVFVPAYLLWRQNGKTYLSKKDNCFDYNTVEVNARELWKFYFDNQETIKPEKSKPFQLSTTVNGKLSLTTVTSEKTGHRNLKVIAGANSIEKFFDTFQLERTAQNGNKTETNINYDHNIRLVSKHLTELLGDFVVEIEKKKLLKRTARN